MNANAEKWVAALESGKYEQAKGVLAWLDGDGETVVGHCCLGVACEVAIANGVDIHAEVRPYGMAKTRYYTYYSGADDAIGILPKPVMEWLGLSTPDGQYEDDGLRRRLTSLNDGGASFKHIAKVIRSEPGGLFA